MSKNKGLLIVLSGPAGSGKTTLSRMLVEREINCELSISATTREIRVGEKNNIDYFFMTKEEFLQKKNEGGFAETAEVFGNYYGTPKDFLEKKLAEGTNIIMDLDVQGALTLMKIYPDEAYIFVIPKNKTILKERLIKRAREDKKEIQKRLDFVLNEIKIIPKYRYLLINDELEKAYNDLKSILTAEKCRLNAKHFTSLPE